MSTEPYFPCAPILRATIVITFGSLLVACVSSQTKTAPIDGPYPFEVRSPDLKWCNAPMLAGHLTPNARCKTIVRAEEWNNRTGLRVCEGQSYELTIPAGQFWFDSSRRSQPQLGDEGNILMNIFKSWKRLDVPWFVLVAGTLKENAANNGDPTNLQSMGAVKDEAAGTQYAVNTNGELVLFANDAAAPIKRDYFFGNNHGRIWVIVSLKNESKSCD